MVQDFFHPQYHSWSTGVQIGKNGIHLNRLDHFRLQNNPKKEHGQFETCKLYRVQQKAISNILEMHFYCLGELS